MAPYKPASVGAARLVPMAIREGKLAVARLPPPVFPACVPAMLPLLDHSLSPLRRPAGAWRRSLVGVGVAAFVIGAASPLLARPPYGDPPPQGRYQIGDADRAEIRRSMGRPGLGLTGRQLLYSAGASREAPGRMAFMKILAIETSGDRGSVALLADGALLEKPLEGHARHSEDLLPSILQMLAEAELSLRQLDALAFAAGPGAFTGLRLACGVIQGLALGARLPVVPVSSLQALALGAPLGQVLVATDARMGEIYAAAYRNDGTEQIGRASC